MADSLPRRATTIDGAALRVLRLSSREPVAPSRSTACDDDHAGGGSRRSSASPHGDGRARQRPGAFSGSDAPRSTPAAATPNSHHVVARHAFTGWRCGPLPGVPGQDSAGDREGRPRERPCRRPEWQLGGAYPKRLYTTQYGTDLDFVVAYSPKGIVRDQRPGRASSCSSTGSRADRGLRTSSQAGGRITPATAWPSSAPDRHRARPREHARPRLRKPRVPRPGPPERAGVYVSPGARRTRRQRTGTPRITLEAGARAAKIRGISTTRASSRGISRRRGAPYAPLEYIVIRSGGLRVGAPRGAGPGPLSRAIPGNPRRESRSRPSPPTCLSGRRGCAARRPGAHGNRHGPAGKRSPGQARSRQGGSRGTGSERDDKSACGCGRRRRRSEGAC
jgi:hypothetical protein